MIKEKIKVFLLRKYNVIKGDEVKVGLKGNMNIIENNGLVYKKLFRGWEIKNLFF